MLSKSSVEARMSDEFIRDLRHLIARKQVVAVVGCGVSIGATRGSPLAGLASWAGLLKDGVRQCIELRRANDAWATLVKSEIQYGLDTPGETESLVSAADKIARKLGAPDDGEFSRWLRTTVGALDVQDDGVIKALCALKIPLATTNYDDLLEKISGLRPLTWKDGRRVDRFLRGEEPGILHLHGHWEHPETVVLGSHSYEDILRDDRAQASQRAMASLNSLLFVGCGDGLEDSNIGGVINWFGKVFSSTEYRHYRLALDSQVEELQRKHPPNQRIIVVPYGQKHSDLPRFLERLLVAGPSGPTGGGGSTRPAVINVYRDELLPDLDDDLKQAHTLLKEHRYADAETSLKGVLGRLERTTQINERDLDLEKRLSRCRYMLGGALLCLQKTDEAREVWKRVNPLDISDGARIELARGRAQLGDVNGAEALLPLGSSDDRIEDTRKLIAICQDQLPDTPPKEPFIKVLASYALLQEGRLGDAVRWTLDALDTEDSAEDPLCAGNAAGVLLTSLQRTIQEQPPLKQLLPLSLRESVVQRINDLLTYLIDENQNVPPLMRISAHKMARSFHVLTMDFHRAQQARDVLASLGEAQLEPPEPTLAASGRLEEALDRISGDAHPWRQRVQKATLLKIAGRFEEADREFLALAEEFPGKAPIEYYCAQTLLKGTNVKEALQHAQVAYSQLPGLGYRLLLVQALLLNQRPQDAWRLLQPVKNTSDPSVLRALCMAAERSRRPAQETLELVQRYLSLVPTDSIVRIGYASQLKRLGDPIKAREEAWVAVGSSGSENLDIGRLHAAAALQLLTERPDDVAKARVQQIARILKERFPQDPNAEAIRLELLGGLGFPGQDKIDYPLMERAGIAWAGTADEVLNALRQQYRQRQEMADAVLRLYRTGMLSLESLCQWTNISPPLFLSRIVHLREHQVLLCPPPSKQLETVQVLPGSELLIGEMELLLLHHLGLLGSLRDSLGPQGRIVVFEDVEASIRKESIPPLWQQQDRRGRLRTKDELWELLFVEDKIVVEKGQPTVRDIETASKRGYGIVRERVDELGSPVIHIRPKSLLSVLNSSGAIPNETMQRLEQTLPGQSEHSTKIPEIIYLELWFLELLHKECSLHLILRVLPSKIWIGPETLTQLRNERDSLRMSLEASERAATLIAFVSAGMREGWIPPSLERIEQPLPILVDPQLKPVKESMGRALAYRIALEANPHRFLLTADFVVAAPFTASAPPALMSLFHWTREAYETLKDRLERVSNRVVHLPEFLELLNLPWPRLHQVRCDLAELGFVDALTAADVRQLAKNYQGLKGEVPRRLLDRAEWMARQREHPGALSARQQIARLYAESIWAVWDEDTALQERELITLGTLERTESLEEISPGSLEDVFFDLGALASAQPQSSFVEVGEHSEWLRPAAESKAGQLWAYLAQWAGDGHRRAAMLRAIQRLLCLLDELCKDGGPSPEQLAPLFIALHATEKQTATAEQASSFVVHLAFTDMTFGALATLSANWEFKPLSGVTIEFTQQPSGKTFPVVLENVLAWGAHLLEQSKIGGDAQEFQFAFPLGDGGESIVVQVLPEALVLRADKETIIVENATALVRWYAPHDGLLADLWQQLRSRPDDIGLKRAVARRAVLSPMRLVRADPYAVYQWLLPACLPMLPELRGMMNEPERLPDGPIWDMLFKDPLRNHETMRQGSEIPGLLPGFMVQTRLRERGYIGEVHAAVRRLEDAQNQPAGRICGDILFLRLAAANKPIVRFGKGEIDLRDELPERLARVVHLCMSQPAADSLAAAEASLLRLCAHIIETKAIPQQLSLRDGLWLTYRLYQWLISQLEVLSPDGRRAALLALQRNAPQPNPEDRCGPDILNPFRFALDRFDHRLATVLYALRLMEDAGLRAAVLSVQTSNAALAGEENAQADFRSVSSPGLESMLIELASRIQTETRVEQRPLGPSQLGWDAPTSVPELALSALLAVNEEAFFSLSEEVRRCWFLRLPPSEDKLTTLHRDTLQLLLAVAGAQARRLSATEQLLLKERLRFLPGQPSEEVRLRLVWLTMIGLFAAGHTDLEDEIRQIFREHLRHKLAPLAFASYLVALSFVAPVQIEQQLMDMISMVRTHNLQAFPFVAGLGRIVFMGSQEGARIARELLRKLAQDALFKDNDEFRQLTKLLNL